MIRACTASRDRVIIPFGSLPHLSFEIPPLVWVIKNHLYIGLYFDEESVIVEL